MAAYLGTQGFCLELALCPGTQHSASEIEYNFERILPLATRLTHAPMLLRADSGFDSARLMCAIDHHATTLQRVLAFIIKWNPRTPPSKPSPKTGSLTPAPSGPPCAQANESASGQSTWTSDCAG